MSAILTEAELRREWLAAHMNTPHADREALYAGLEFEWSLARACVLARDPDPPS